jgi:tetratricopeptide (TPR) repeat protein
VEPERYEDARFSYARLLEKFGWTSPVVERMMLYFIRTDNLKETLSLRRWFEVDPKKRHITPETTAELGGYLLDKQFEEPVGVPNEYVPYIESVRGLLLKAVMEKPSLPEAHYHLARYYHSFGNRHEERVTLEVAIHAFDNAREESVRRINYHIDTHRRLADVLINDREFIPAEEQLIKGINLYQDALSRFRDPRSREAIARYQFGSLYAGLGDLEYFVKLGDTSAGDMSAAIRYYRQAEDNGWAPPEMLYRMGAAYYQLENWKDALEKIFAASKTLPLNDRLLFALGNVSFKRGDYHAAQGYYNRLLDRLESRRVRLPMLLPNDRPEYLELAERLMMAQNNAGAAYEMLAAQTGNQSYRNQAMALYSRSELSWDSRTRDPRSMIRSGSTPLPFINARNALRPQAGYEPQIFIRIDRDAAEPSVWEELAPFMPERY